MRDSLGESARLQHVMVCILVVLVLLYIVLAWSLGLLGAHLLLSSCAHNVCTSELNVWAPAFSRQLGGATEVHYFHVFLQGGRQQEASNKPAHASDETAGVPKPVEPNPPAPLTVSSKDSTTSTSGVEMRSSTNCAMRSPASTAKRGRYRYGDKRHTLQRCAQVSTSTDNPYQYKAKEPSRENNTRFEAEPISLEPPGHRNECLAPSKQVA